MTVLVPILVVLGLVLLNGFFVAGEFALVGAPRAAIQRRARQGEATARIVLRILQRPREQDRYLATVQLGITAASLGLGMYGEQVIAGWLGGLFFALGIYRWLAAHALASVLAVTVLTYFHIVIGEMAPKTVALQRAERMALYLIPAVAALEIVLYPIVVALSVLATAILRVFGVRRSLPSGYSYTPEELQYIIEESQATGSLREEAGEIMLELFEFGELTVESVMVPRVAVRGFEVSTPQQEIIDIMLAERHSRYPVYEDDLDHIVGQVHVKTLFARLLEGRPLSPIDYAAPIPFVPSSATLDEVLETMRDEAVQMVVVMDEFGGTAGIATIEDLFEEVVGPVPTAAGAPEVPEIQRLRGGRWRVQGTARLEELSDALDSDVRQEDVTTVSGLVLDLLGRPARVGDQVVHNGFRFTVVEVEERGVAAAIVQRVGRPTPPAPSPPGRGEG